MKTGCYDEQTLVEPYDQLEVYGQDGFGWYTYAKDADNESFSKFSKTASKNPLFVYLGGCTKKKLNGLGFITV